MQDQLLIMQMKKCLMETPVWSTATYGTETWMVKKADKKSITAIEMMAFRKMLSISGKEHRTNASITEQLGGN